MLLMMFSLKHFFPCWPMSTPPPSGEGETKRDGRREWNRLGEDGEDLLDKKGGQSVRDQSSPGVSPSGWVCVSASQYAQQQIPPRPSTPQHGLFNSGARNTRATQDSQRQTRHGVDGPLRSSAKTQRPTALALGGSFSRVGRLVAGRPQLFRNNGNVLVLRVFAKGGGEKRVLHSCLLCLPSRFPHVPALP